MNSFIVRVFVIIALFSFASGRGHELSRKEELEISMNFLHYSGRHTVHSPVVGARANEIALIQDHLSKDSILAELEQVIYQARFLRIIPCSLHTQAEELAKRRFETYIQKYADFGLHSENAVAWGEYGLDRTYVYETENDWNTWCCFATVYRGSPETICKDGKYLPTYVVAYHEFMHVEETFKRQKNSEIPLEGMELLTTLKTMDLLDQIYKELHGIEAEETVDYHLSFTLRGKRWDLGHFVNLVRIFEEKYGSLVLAITSEEFLEYIR